MHRATYQDLTHIKIGSKKHSPVKPNKTPTRRNEFVSAPTVKTLPKRKNKSKKTTLHLKFS